MGSPNFVGRKYNLSKEDFFETPSYCVDRLLEVERFYGFILEPCCGTGSISKVLKAKGFDIRSSDIKNYGYGEVKDFLKITEKVDNIITNPPYNILNSFMGHCLEISKKKVALLLRTNSLEGIERYSSIYSKNLLKTVYVFCRRVRFNSPKYKKPRGMISYSWFVFDKNFKGISPVIKWIDH